MNKHAEYFDCTLIEGAAGVAVEYQGRPLPGVQVPPGALGGLVGVTVWAPAGGWVFKPYLDQSMRRRPELDDVGRIGWANERSPAGWTAPRGLLPGAHGNFVGDATETVTIAVPQEFFQLCGWYGVTSEDVLRAFIADSCSIEHTEADPRADRYDCHGPAQRYAAEDYLNATFGPLADIRNVVVCRLDDDDEDNDDDEECLIIQIENDRSRLRSALIPA